MEAAITMAYNTGLGTASGLRTDVIPVIVRLMVARCARKCSVRICCFVTSSPALRPRLPWGTCQRSDQPTSPSAMAQNYTQAQYAQLLAAQQQQQYSQAASPYQQQYAAQQYAAQQQQLAAQQLAAQQQAAQQYAAQQYAAQQYVPQQQQRTVQLALPEDAFPGKSYEFDAPDGTVKSFVVPQGYGPGMPIVVSY